MSGEVQGDERKRTTDDVSKTKRDGVKGLDHLSLLFGQPVMGGARRQGKVAIKGNWMIGAIGAG